MKLKKYISLLLLTVYLLATGGSAYASLACHCVAMKSHVEHACCTCCDHKDDLPAAKADITAPCCSNHHSTEIELYVRVSSETEESGKSLVMDLPPSLCAECPCPAHIPFLRETLAERRAPFVRAACVLPSGLRAPPVLA